MRSRLFAGVLGVLLIAHAPAQRVALDPTTPAAPHRQRLYLKDGSYQVVMSYKVQGTRVTFISAERGGDTEEIPLALVDLNATQKWESQHAAPDPATGQRPAPPLDPELLKEEQSRAALSPEVAPDLRLEPSDSVLALDTFHGGPELIPLNQAMTDVNKQTGHSVLRQMVNPAAATHQIVQLHGEKAEVQLHVDQPVFYIRADEDQPTSGQALTVDTHGAPAADTSRPKPTTRSDYVIVRTDVRQDARIVTSFNISALGTVKQERDVQETDVTELPGGHWLKVVPRGTLLVGEYALVEILGERAVNLAVWDFGVHPTAPENRDILLPEKRRPSALERHRPQ